MHLYDEDENSDHFDANVVVDGDHHFRLRGSQSSHHVALFPISLLPLQVVGENMVVEVWPLSCWCSWWFRFSNIMIVVVMIITIIIRMIFKWRSSSRPIFRRTKVISTAVTGAAPLGWGETSAFINNSLFHRHHHLSCQNHNDCYESWCHSIMAISTTKRFMILVITFLTGCQCLARCTWATPYCPFKQSRDSD